MFLLTFEEDAASVSGLPVKMLNLLITVMTALVISTAIKIVGALLVSALLTIPAACSLLIARSFKQSVVFSVIIAEIAVVIGLVAAGIWNLAPGATIVLLLIAMLILTLIGKRGFSA
ncbi:High-affinity zinc uptake system membrane protein ZnuB [compost metagenome]